MNSESDSSITLTEGNVERSEVVDFRLEKKLPKRREAVRAFALTASRGVSSKWCY
jgi:hypothetical protein